jgi:hypothetical protein
VGVGAHVAGHTTQENFVKTTFNSDSTDASPRGRTRRGLLAVCAIVAVGGLAACRPVVGNANDKTPPRLSITIGGAAIEPAGNAIVATEGAPVIIVGHDDGGVDSLVSDLTVHYDCIAPGGQLALGGDFEPFDDTTGSKRYEYSTETHLYHGTNALVTDFAPDPNNNGLVDGKEQFLRWNDLVITYDEGEIATALASHRTGSACSLSDGRVGTAAAAFVIITAHATNTASESRPDDANTSADSTATINFTPRI